MSVIRVNKTDNYTVMSNYHFKDKNLSLKAKGLLSEMLSLPEDWDYTIAGLAYINKEGEPAIKTALMELKENGYLEVTKLMPKETASGRYEYVYDIYEIPKGKQVEKEKPKPKTESHEIEFDAFWQVYPKKKSRATAERAFEKAIKKIDLQTMLNAVEKQKNTKQWKEKDGQFIPYPATWLNAECWNDEIEEEKSLSATIRNREATSKKSNLEALAKQFGVTT